MNFLHARIGTDGASVVGNGFELELGATDREVTAGIDGREIMVGLRPEYLRDTPREGSGPTAQVRFKVELVETLGHEILVHGHLGEDALVAQVAPQNRPEIDTEVELLLELDKLHLFDVATEQHLKRGD